MKFLWEDARCIFQKYMLPIDLTDQTTCWRFTCLLSNFLFLINPVTFCLRSMLKFLDIRLTHSLLFQSTYQHKKSFALLCKIDAFWKILDHQLLCFNWWFKHLRENIRKKHSNPTYLGWEKWRRCVLQRSNLVSKTIIGISVNTQQEKS